MVEPPTRIPCHQGALRSASGPSINHQMGNKQAAAISMRADVKGSGGTVPSNRLAAGRPIAQTSMDNMHAPLAAHAEEGTGLDVILASVLGAI